MKCGGLNSVVGMGEFLTVLDLKPTTSREKYSSEKLNQPIT